MSHTLAFLFFELWIEFKSSLGFFVRTTRMISLKKKLSWCWLVRYCQPAVLWFRIASAKAIAQTRKTWELSPSLKRYNYDMHTLLLRKHVVIDSYNRFSWQLWFLLKNILKTETVLFELQVQQSGICWLIFSDIALLCAKQVSLRLSFVKPKQCLRYSRCATKQRAAAYQWLSVCFPIGAVGKPVGRVI